MRETSAGLGLIGPMVGALGARGGHVVAMKIITAESAGMFILQSSLELPKRIDFDLADALSGEPDFPADLLQR